MIVFAELTFLILLLFPFYSKADQLLVEDYKSARGIFWSELYPKGYTLYCGEEFKNSKKLFLVRA